METAYELTAPAACSFPQASLLLSIEPRGTTVSMEPLADRSGYVEAYRYANRGEGRGQTMTERVENGFFGSFPLIDESEQHGLRGGRQQPRAGTVADSRGQEER